MKRSLLYRDSNSFYSAPPLESTLLIDTGGIDDPVPSINPVGRLPSTNISASVSSGTRTFQYNRFFWNRELFTFNYKNNAIGIAIAYYNYAAQSYCFAIMPIFLPRFAMSIIQSLSNNPTGDPAARVVLVKELIYYLNLGFTTGGTGNNYGTSPSSYPGTQQYYFTASPWLLASDAKGTILPGPVVNNPNFPIYQDGNSPPPLIWTYSGNNNQLCLQVNRPFFVNGPNGNYANDYIGFQIISLEEYMNDAPYYTLNAPPVIFYSRSISGPQSFYPAQSYGDNVGWCSQGAFTTGFAQSKNYTSFENSIDSNSSYSDIYTAAERLALYTATRFPVFTGISALPSSFIAFTNTFRLVTNASGNSGFLLSSFMTSLIPTRFLSISSNALTRNQKRPVSSNNPTLDAGTLAIQFITLDGLKTWTDDTISGLVESSSPGFGSQKSGSDDCSIVSLDPMQSLQVLDITIKDEWGNTIQNYNQNINDPTNIFNREIFGGWECGAAIVGQYAIAPWVVSYNPIPSSPESLLMNESWWASYWQGVYQNNPTNPAPNPCPSDFAPATPQSTTLVQFGRVLGY